MVLYEKSDRLGGQLLHSDVFSFKWPMKRYKDWLIRQVGKYGIDVRMNTAPTRDELIAGGYDAMIVALGAKPVLPAASRAWWTIRAGPSTPPATTCS